MTKGSVQRCWPGHEKINMHFTKLPQAFNTSSKKLFLFSFFVFLIFFWYFVYFIKLIVLEHFIFLKKVKFDQPTARSTTEFIDVDDIK